MGPISPVSIGAAGASARPASIPNHAVNAAALDSGRAAGMGTASGGLTGTSAVNNVFSAVADLMESLGGGIENDKVLRMMIALIILLALLQSSQGGKDTGLDALASLSSGGNARSQAVGLYSSSTTIAIQQTTTTVAYSMESYALTSASDAGQAQGGQIDVSA